MSNVALAHKVNLSAPACLRRVDMLKVSGCMECHVITGEFDYFMIVRTRDDESFNRLHAEQLLHLPGVRQVRSFMGLKQVLSATQFPV